MGEVNYDSLRWQEAVDFHGHICPGIAVGYRASVYALKLLDLEGKNIGETHNAIVENDVCGLDGVQIVTGCTIGNDSLIINNQGKKAFSWVEKKSGQGVRIMLAIPLWGEYDEAISLHHKVKNGVATLEEKKEFIRVRTLRGQELMDLVDEDLFTWQKISLVIPSTPRLHDFITCAECGEATMKPWIKNKNGRSLCSHCFSLEP